MNLIKKKINCFCSQDLVLALFPHWPRSMYVKCCNCNLSLFIKRFDVDSNTTEYEQKKRFSKEKTGIEQLWQLFYNESCINVPKVFGAISKPYFALIEDFVEGMNLSKLLHQSLSTGTWNNVYNVLSIISLFIIALNKKRNRLCQHNLPQSLVDVTTILNSYKNYGPLSHLANELLKIHNLWMLDDEFVNNLEIGLVYDGFSFDHFLVDSKIKQITIIDAESLHIDVTLADVGAVCAELKLFFSWYAYNEYAAEPFISFFLRDYYSRRYGSNIKGFNTFTRNQAYFMGRRFIYLTQLRDIVDKDRTWFLQTAYRIWSIINQPYMNIVQTKRIINAIFFDFYDTLVHINSDEWNIQNYQAVQKYIRNHTGKHESTLPSIERIRELYYSTIQEMILESKETYPDIDLVTIWFLVLSQAEFGLPVSLLIKNNRKFIVELLRIFRRTALRSLDPVTGLYDVLKQLKVNNIRIGIISDAQAIFLLDEMEKIQIIDYIDYLYISSDLRFRKPDCRIFEQAISCFGFRNDECIFVGDDMFRDIYGAQQAGLIAVYKESLHGKRFYADCIPDYTITDLRQVIDIVNMLRKKDIND